MNTHTLNCNKCKRHLTAAETIEKWCVECRSDVRTEEGKAA